jgi:hypothetical protein
MFDNLSAITIRLSIIVPDVFWQIGYKIYYDSISWNGFYYKKKIIINNTKLNTVELIIEIFNFGQK